MESSQIYIHIHMKCWKIKQQKKKRKKAIHDRNEMKLQRKTLANAGIEIKMIFSQEIQGRRLAKELIRGRISWNFLTWKYKEIVPAQHNTTFFTSLNLVITTLQIEKWKLNIYLRVSNEGETKRVPTKGANTQLNNSKFLGRIFNFKVLDIEAVKLHGLAPWSACDSGHFQVDGHEIGGFHVGFQVSDCGLEV